MDHHYFYTEQKESKDPFVRLVKIEKPRQPSGSNRAY